MSAARNRSEKTTVVIMVEVRYLSTDMRSAAEVASALRTAFATSGITANVGSEIMEPTSISSHPARPKSPTFVPTTTQLATSITGPQQSGLPQATIMTSTAPHRSGDALNDSDVSRSPQEKFRNTSHIEDNDIAFIFPAVGASLIVFFLCCTILVWCSRKLRSKLCDLGRKPLSQILSYQEAVDDVPAMQARQEDAGPLELTPFAKAQRESAASVVHVSSFLEFPVARHEPEAEPEMEAEPGTCAINSSGTSVVDAEIDIGTAVKLYDNLYAESLHDPPEDVCNGADDVSIKGLRLSLPKSSAVPTFFSSVQPVNVLQSPTITPTSLEEGAMSPEKCDTVLVSQIEELCLASPEVSIPGTCSLANIVEGVEKPVAFGNAWAGHIEEMRPASPDVFQSGILLPTSCANLVSMNSEAEAEPESRDALHASQIEQHHATSAAHKLNVAKANIPDTILAADRFSHSHADAALRKYVSWKEHSLIPLGLLGQASDKTDLSRAQMIYMRGSQLSGFHRCLRVCPQRLRAVENRLPVLRQFLQPGVLMVGKRLPLREASDWPQLPPPRPPLRLSPPSNDPSPHLKAPPRKRSTAKRKSKNLRKVNLMPALPPPEQSASSCAPIAAVPVPWCLDKDLE